MVQRYLKKHSLIKTTALSLRNDNFASGEFIEQIKKLVKLLQCTGPRRDEVTGEWSSLHKEELNDLYSSPNIVRVIKSRRMRWAGHVARMGEERGGSIGSWWGYRREGDH